MHKLSTDSQTIELFVSPQGNDSWSGKLPDPNKTGTNGPFATIEKAQKAVRKMRGRSGLKQPVRISLRKGTYFLKEPLTLTPFDSGDSINHITYSAYRNERPVISGGRCITGWKEQKLNGKTVWVASVPKLGKDEWCFRELFVNGKRRYRPRLPRKGFYRIAGNPDVTDETACNVGSDRFIYQEGDIRKWSHLQDVEVVILHFWIESRMKIKKVNEKKRLVVLDRKSRMRLTDDFSTEGGEYYVDNVFEEMQRGEWYLDRSAGRLFYCLLPGERLENSEIIAPYLTELVSVEGNSEKGRPIRCVTFRGITFSHNQWNYPDDIASSNQAANDVPGAVTLSQAENCSIEHCSFTHLGTYAIDLREGCTNITIRGNVITDLGAGGIKIWHGCRRNTVSDNEIGNGGIIFHSAVGVLIGKSSGNKVLHNHIHNFYYTGISVGWTWGYTESDAYGNIIEYNHVHDIGRGWLSDMGGIYTLGVSPGTRIRHNVFHYIRSRGYGGWAIYTDEGSSDILIENNLAYATKSAVFHQHYGKDNIIRNNILAFGEESQITRSRIEEHKSFVFQNNIVCFNSGDLFSGNWKKIQAVLENNLYYDMRKKKVRFPGGLTLRQCQKKGMDKGSIVADPRFLDPENGNFTLSPNSPAFLIGFKEFDLSNIGPRTTDFCKMKNLSPFGRTF